VFDIKEYEYLPLTLHALGISTICAKHQHYMCLA